MCRTKKSTKKLHENSERCYEVHAKFSFHESDNFFVDSVECNEKMHQAFAEIQVGPNSFPIKFKIDTSSQVSIFPHLVYSRLKLSHPLKKTATKLTAYNGDTLNNRLRKTRMFTLV